MSVTCNGFHPPLHFTYCIALTVKPLQKLFVTFSVGYLMEQVFKSKDVNSVHSKGPDQEQDFIQTHILDYIAIPHCRKHLLQMPDFQKMLDQNLK